MRLVIAILWNARQLVTSTENCGVPAYAMGWFGLRERVIESVPDTEPAVTENSFAADSPAPTVEPMRWVSLNGYRESPEYLANAEWLRFREEYRASHTISNDNSWMNGLDEQTINTCHYYGVYDQNMLDELKAVCDKPGKELLLSSVKIEQMKGKLDAVQYASFI